MPDRFPFPVVDLHADLLWRTEVRGKDPWTVCEGEMMDLPRTPTETLQRRSSLNERC